MIENQSLVVFLRHAEAASEARGAKKWSEMRSKGIGRGKQLSKPKKTAADFAREAELERRKSQELEPEEVAAVQSGTFSGKFPVLHLCTYPYFKCYVNNALEGFVTVSKHEKALPSQMSLIWPSIASHS